MARVRQVPAGSLVNALIAIVGVPIVLSGCTATASTTTSGAADRPVPAPAPSSPLRTPVVTFTRIGPSGVSQTVVIGPDGQWRFKPYRGSVRASVINHGRLITAERVALAATLAGAAFRAEAARPPGTCRGGASYRLTVAAMDGNAATDAAQPKAAQPKAAQPEAAWTECDAADRPTLTDLATRITTLTHS